MVIAGSILCESAEANGCEDDVKWCIEVGGQVEHVRLCFEGYGLLKVVN